MSDTVQNQTTVCQDEMQNLVAGGGTTDDKRDKSDLDPKKQVGKVPLMQETPLVESETVAQQEGDQSTPHQEDTPEPDDISLTEEKKLDHIQPLNNTDVQTGPETNALVSEPNAQTRDPDTQMDDTQPQASGLDASAFDTHTEARSLDAQTCNPDTQYVEDVHASGQDAHAIDDIAGALGLNAHSDDLSSDATQDSGGTDEEFDRKKEIAQASCRQNSFTDEDISRGDEAYFKKYGNRHYSGEALAKIMMEESDIQPASGGTATVNDTGHPAKDGTPHTCEVDVSGYGRSLKKVDHEYNGRSQARSKSMESNWSKVTQVSDSGPSWPSCLDNYRGPYASVEIY